MLPVTVRRPPARAGTGAILSLVGRGLQFSNVNQMETHTGSPGETQTGSELPRMEQERGLACLLVLAPTPPPRPWRLGRVLLRAQPEGWGAEEAGWVMLCSKAWLNSSGRAEHDRVDI